MNKEWRIPDLTDPDRQRSKSLLIALVLWGDLLVLGAIALILVMRYG